MTTALIVFSAVLVASVVLHLFFWLDSKKRFDECIKQAESINEHLRQLEANDTEIDRMLDDAEAESQRIDDEIKALRAVMFGNRRRTNFEN